MRTFIIFLFLFGWSKIFAQTPQPPPPPRPIEVFADPLQGLFFGAVFRGPTGGSIIVFPDGSRSVTGDLQKANTGTPVSPAIFEIEANLGTIINIVNGPDVILNGSNGGTARLVVGESNLGSSFITAVTPPLRTILRIGGTLVVGGPLITPSGVYNGFFSVTFVQQ